MPRLSSFHDYLPPRERELRSMCTEMGEEMAARLRIKELENINSWDLTVGDVGEMERLKSKINHK